ncbi:MAG: hypothetical protein ACKONH_07840 [Planctomycetia bacterium]
MKKPAALIAIALLAAAATIGVLSLSGNGAGRRLDEVPRRQAMSAVTFRTLAPRTPLVEVAEEVLRRTGARPVSGTADVILDIQAGIGEEGFRIEGDAPVRITGNDDRGLLYGIGRFLRGPWQGTSVPQRKVRGMYFATHFHNWYHDAPLPEVVRYVEELALWGCNALVVWFDMHHYQGLQDPDAVQMVERLRAILAAAQRVGIRPGLLVLANEAYATTPVEIRATNAKDQNGYFASPGGFYGVEICPNAPRGLEQILQLRSGVLDAFGDIAFEYFVIWPYDQGGCTCAKCAPWGTNGYLKTAEGVARLARERYPQAKIVLSTWYFDHFVHGEWDGMRAAFAGSKPEWIDYLLIDDYGDFPKNPLEHGIPGGFPVVGFAEISMVGMSPWGGFGANPRPRHWQKHHQSTRDLLGGGFPYSEGIYEDANKVLQLQLGWDPGRDTREILREYAAAHFSPAEADGIVEAMWMMEDLCGLSLEETADGVRFRHWNPPVKAEACFELVSRIDRGLSEGIRRSWRWRILWLRAALEAEIKRTGGKPSERATGYFRELIELYHARNAEGACHPPEPDGGENKPVDTAVQAG